MSSDSEHSEVELPSDATLEKALRNTVREGIAGSELTVNSVRAAAEERLGLPAGFFKNHGEWKAKSKDIISDAVNEPASQKSPSPAASPPKKKASRPAKATKKRASNDNAQKTRKRQKRAVSESDESDDQSTQASDESEIEEPEPVKKKAAAPKSRATKQYVPSSGSEEEAGQDVPDGLDHDEVMPPQPLKDSKTKATDDSESEMSVVLDEAPPKKRRQKSASAETKTKAKAKATKAPKATKASTNAAKDSSPDEAEIKRLQGWLLKCGIRKLWYRELAPYDTSKSKIKHLKDMLKDAGMDGRYSVEKAKAIKEQRELAADLEAVQEGAKQWGNKGDDNDDPSDAEPSSRPRRGAAAARFVDFGDEDDEDDDD